MSRISAIVRLAAACSICLVLSAGVDAAWCRAPATDGSGAVNVDWFVAFKEYRSTKLHVLVAGKGGESARQFETDIDDADTSPPSLTLDQGADGDSGTVLLAYNDQPPAGAHKSDSKPVIHNSGHMKGVLAASPSASSGVEEAFWLFHSLPKWPVSRDRGAHWDDALKNSLEQHFYCFSFNITRAVASQIHDYFLTTRPNEILQNTAGHLDLTTRPLWRKIRSGLDQPNGNNELFSFGVTAAGGEKVQIYAGSWASKPGLLWAGFPLWLLKGAPQTDFNVQTWEQGSARLDETGFQFKIRKELNLSLNGDGGITIVKHAWFPLAPKCEPQSKLHSKLGWSRSAAFPLSCFADLNLEHLRGGGMACALPGSPSAPAIWQFVNKFFVCAEPPAVAASAVHTFSPNVPPHPESVGIMEWFRYLYDDGQNRVTTAGLTCANEPCN